MADNDSGTTSVPLGSRTVEASATTVPASPTPPPVVHPTGGVQPSAEIGLTEDDFRQDGELRVATRREILESAPSRGTTHSYNEILNKTTVTTTVNGATVSFDEDGDTRPKGNTERGTDSAIRAFDSANESKNNE